MRHHKYSKKHSFVFRRCLWVLRYSVGARLIIRLNLSAYSAGRRLRSSEYHLGAFGKPRSPAARGVFFGASVVFLLTSPSFLSESLSLAGGRAHTEAGWKRFLWRPRLCSHRINSSRSARLCELCRKHPAAPLLWIVVFTACNCVPP